MPFVGGRFNFLSHGTSGRERAGSLLTMIERNESLSDIIDAAIDAYKRSGEQNNSFSRYLEKEFMGEGVREDSQTKQDFINNYLSTARSVLPDRFFH